MNSASLALHPGGKLIASGGWSGSIDPWDLSGESTPKAMPAKDLRALDFARSGRTLWAAVEGIVVRSWSWPEGTPRTQWKNSGADAVSGLGGVYSLAAGEKWVTAGCRDGAVRLLRASDGQLQSTRQLSAGPLGCVCLSRDESLAVVGSYAGDVIVLDVPSRRVRARGGAGSGVDLLTSARTWSRARSRPGCRRHKGECREVKV